MENTHHCLFQHHTERLKNTLPKPKILCRELLENCIDKKINIHLKHDAKPFYGKSYRISNYNLYTVNKEVERLLEPGVLKIYETESGWAATCFNIAKKTVQ